jgi:DNA invertase Pin-like site-specific DNA recombinase
MNRQRSDIRSEESASGSRAALYMRVSTGRQAEHDLSIPDQRSQLNSWCRALLHKTLYMRVSTWRQAEHDLSISDQRTDGNNQYDAFSCDAGTKLRARRTKPRRYNSRGGRRLN